MQARTVRAIERSDTEEQLVDAQLLRHVLYRASVQISRKKQENNFDALGRGKPPFVSRTNVVYIIITHHPHGQSDALTGKAVLFNGKAK